MMTGDDREWLETDGLGGFASGTVSGIRTRRYHALLLPAVTPPTGRVALVNGLEAWLTTPGGRFALSSQRYAPDVIYPDGAARIASFSREPWPKWIYALEDGTRVSQEIVAIHGRPLLVLTWRLLSGSVGTLLEVRPLVSGRDYHATHHENGAIRLSPDAQADGTLTWRLYEGFPAIRSSTNGRFAEAPVWYRNFLYAEERDRGLDSVEDLASPGVFSWDLSSGTAHWALGTAQVPAAGELASDAHRLREEERRRRETFAGPLERAADAYVVRRGHGSTIIAGYPWFTDWGRDTFIALPGLCLATGRLAEAREILLAWAETVSEGMLPNRFPDGGDVPEFNAVDASLWFVIAVEAFLDEAERARFVVAEDDHARLDAAVLAIVSGFAAGTRHGIRADDDGLLAAGVPGEQLTWMDARVNGREITPRIGKPVEVQALWVNALAVAGRLDTRWREWQRRAEGAFAERFWNEARGCLRDVVDVDHVRGTNDDRVRPNQLLAIGGLPRPLITGERARRALDLVERELLVPVGLRTLAPFEPGYLGTYGGGVASRDGAYHQGTAWPWLLYAYADASLRTRPAERAARDVEQILAPTEAHLERAGLGHVSEVFSGDAPHAPGGCPFQAWSLAALIRVRALRGAARVVAASGA